MKLDEVMGIAPHAPSNQSWFHSPCWDFKNRGARLVIQSLDCERSTIPLGADFVESFGVTACRGECGGHLPIEARNRTLLVVPVY